MSLRLTAETAKDLQECAEILEIPKTAVIEKGIQMVKALVKEKE